MGFGNFFSKALEFAGKAIVEIASEVVNQCPTAITKQYLEKAQKLNLTSRQRLLLEDASKMNNLLSQQMRNKRTISDNIKNNKEKINEFRLLTSEKAYEVWVVVSKIISDSESYKVSSYKNEKSISFPDNDNTKLLLTDFANGLLSFNNDISFNSDVLTYFKKVIPTFSFENTPVNFFDELKNIVNEYSVVFKQNSNNIDLLSKENITLEDNLVDAKERISEINFKLKPLLGEIKEFCRPMFNELNERDQRR